MYELHHFGENIDDASVTENRRTLRRLCFGSLYTAHLVQESAAKFVPSNCSTRSDCA